MQNVLNEMQYILESDVTIRHYCAFETDEVTGITYPSVAQNNIPEGMRDPYICIREESFAEAEDHIDEMVVSFDVVAEKKSLVNGRMQADEAVRRLATRIEQLFDRRHMMPHALIALRDGVYPIATDDPSIAAKNVKIRVRIARTDLLHDRDVAHAREIPVYAQLRNTTK